MKIMPDAYEDTGKRRTRLRNIIAQGNLDEHESFSISFNADGKALIFDFPEMAYVINMSEILSEVLDFREAYKLCLKIAKSNPPIS